MAKIPLVLSQVREWHHSALAYLTDKNKLAALEMEHAKKVVDLNAIGINGEIVDGSKTIPRLKQKKKKPG